MDVQSTKKKASSRLVTLSNGVEVDPNDLRHPLLVHESCVPPCSKEEFIISGYMIPYMPISYYMKTMYTINYDFFNVWTHLLPSIIACLLLYNFSQTIDLIEAWPLLVITVGVSLVFLLSTIAHVFHGKSATWHRTVFILGYFGIALNAFTQTVCHFHSVASVDLFNIFHPYIMLISTVLGCFGFTCYAFTQVANHPQRAKIQVGKKLANVLYFIFKMLPCTHRAIILGQEWPGLKYHMLSFFFLGTSPLILDGMYPQKLSPGTFDIFGHSHMWFHIWTWIGCYCDIYAIYLEITGFDGAWKDLAMLESYPTLNCFHIYSTLFLLYSLCVIFYANYEIRQCEAAKSQQQQQQQQQQQHNHNNHRSNKKKQ